MTWLAPAGFLALLALPALVLLRLMGARRRTRVVGALLLWERASAGLPPGAGRRRPPLGPLALELAALAAAALALAHPAWLAAEPAERVLVVLDRTASMGAVGADGSTAWTRGLAALDAWLDRQPRATRYTVRAVPALGAGAVEGDAAAVRAAARATSPVDAGGDPRAAGTLRDHARALLVTDRLPATTADDLLEVIAAGEPRANRALTRLAVPEPGRVFVAVAAPGAGGPCAVALTLDGRPGPTLACAPGDDGEAAAWAAIPADVREIRATLPGGDALPADDTLAIARAAGAPARVAWLGPDAPALRRAVDAALGGGADFGPPGPGAAPLVTVLHRDAPALPPAGPLLVVDPAGPLPDVPWVAADGAVALAGPLARALADLGWPAGAPRATGACPEPPRGATVHLRSDAGAVALHVPAPGGDRVVLGLPASGGWELTPAYPVLLGRLVHALVPAEARARWPIATRDPAESDLRGAAGGRRPGRARPAAATPVVASGRPWLAALALLLIFWRLRKK